MSPRINWDNSTLFDTKAAQGGERIHPLLDTVPLPITQALSLLVSSLGQILHFLLKKDVVINKQT